MYIRFKYLGLLCYWLDECVSIFFVNKLLENDIYCKNYVLLDVLKIKDIFKKK